jgi:hypothetical protein
MNSFAEIAEGEALVERHIRLLVPLAFLSPHIIAAIVDGRACGFTVTAFPWRSLMPGPSRRNLANRLGLANEPMDEKRV